MKNIESKKSLKDLANSEEDCNKLSIAIYGVPFNPPVKGWYGGKSKHFSIETGSISEYGATLTVYLDGNITQSSMYGKANVFKIVDEIRKLGYDYQE